jgi:hypothetical protein
LAPPKVTPLGGVPKGAVSVPLQLPQAIQPNEEGWRAEGAEHVPPKLPEAISAKLKKL